VPESACAKLAGRRKYLRTVKALSPNKPEIEQILALIDARIGPTLF